jgi:hypothetical protein
MKNARCHDLYDPEQIAYRIQYARQCILRGMESGSRHYDTCFEMGDGDEVVRALLRAGLKSERFRKAMLESRIAPSLTYALTKFPEFRDAYAALGVGSHLGDDRPIVRS